MEKSIVLNANPLVLAYMGDAVIELFARETLFGTGDTTTAKLNENSKRFVTAVSQSAAVDFIIPLLNDEELNVYKRGRNAKTNNVPRSAAVAEYHKATGMETLFGYLYLLGNVTRARELFEIAYGFRDELLKDNSKPVV